MKTTSAPLKDARGECQACFRWFVGRHSGTTLLLVNHGYERPGHGYLVGRCWGVESEPYQLSCEVTKKWHKSLSEKTLPGLIQDLADLQSGKTKTFFMTFSIRTGGAWGKEERASVTVTEGEPLPAKWAEIQAKLQPYRRKDAPDFVELRARAIAGTTETIGEVESTIKMLAKRIVDWRYSPEKLLAKDAPTPVQENAAQLRAEKKAARDALKAEKATRAAKRNEKAVEAIVKMRRQLAPLYANPAVLARAKEAVNPEWLEGCFTRRDILGRSTDGLGTWALSDLRTDLKQVLALFQDQASRLGISIPR